MITVRAYQSKTVAVFGLARSGLASVEALVSGGARVFAGDDNAEKCAAAKRLGAEVVDFSAIDWRTVTAFVVSPGVPLTHPAPHPFIAAAQAAGVPIIGDMELFAQARADLPIASVVAVTGTNGKSTTTALIGHVLQKTDHATAVGGNIGRAVLDLDPLPEGGIYVLEVSSYQIDLMQSFVPDVAVLLNITPDHLDRHGDLAHYEAVKERLFAGQTANHAAVIGVDDAHGIRFAARLAAAHGQRVIPISGDYVPGGGIGIKDGILLDGIEGAMVPIGNLAGAVALRGRHNWQNAAAAYAAARSLGVPAGAAFRALMTFPGLEHRIERVAMVGNIEFINDSKATNVDAASKALATFERIYWIAGGRPKTTDLSALAPFFPRIRRAYLIGEAARDFAASLNGTVDHVIAGDLGAAVAMAHADALKDGAPSTVLLSPACASFDQFSDYEARGRTFKELVGRVVAHTELAFAGEGR